MCTDNTLTCTYLSKCRPAWTLEAYCLLCSKYSVCLGGGGVSLPNPGVGTYLGREVLTLHRGVPTLAEGYLPWTGGYLPWTEAPTLEWEVSTLDRSYLPWTGGTFLCTLNSFWHWGVVWTFIILWKNTLSENALPRVSWKVGTPPPPPWQEGRYPPPPWLEGMYPPSARR